MVDSGEHHTAKNMPTLIDLKNHRWRKMTKGSMIRDYFAVKPARSAESVPTKAAPPLRRGSCRRRPHQAVKAGYESPAHTATARPPAAEC
jgi:hypothetical protein